jgi:putative hemolysin
MIDTEQLLKETYPEFKWLSENERILGAIKTLLHEDDCNNVIRKNQHLYGYDFLDQLLDDLNFSYNISAGSPDNIPAVGRLLIVANHPIGTLDGLALVQLVRTIRPDVRIVANRLLLNVEPLEAVFLPVEVIADKKNLKDSYKTMLDALKNEEALIIFPAGEVSRITPVGVRDGEWQTGFIKLAKKNRCPIVPIHINAKNSALFYVISMFYKPLATLLLFKEMFNKNNQVIDFKIGSPIPYPTLAASGHSHKQLSQRIRQHVLALGKKSDALFFN